MGIELDYGNILTPRVGARGLDPARLEGDLADRFREAKAKVEAWRAEGALGFLDLPHASATAQRVQEVADSFGKRFEDFVVVGMGGSALGTRALADALLGPDGSVQGKEARRFPRLHVIDNVDPHTLASLLGRLDLRRTLFNIVSKSGATAETMAQYLVVRGRVAEVVEEGQVREHFLFTTDPEDGALRRIAEAEGVLTMSIPKNVGGRFSVLSSVGLLPAAVCGIDPSELLAGAAEMEERCRTAELLANPAGVFATVLHAADRELGASVHVFMPYADRLGAAALWFQQLWAESLGKGVDGGSDSVGPTPLPARGASDQHGQLQLFMEGPLDKVVIFLGVGGPWATVEIPELHPDIPELDYLGGRTLLDLLDAERIATTEALRRGGRPSLTLELPRLDASTMGGFFMLLQVATMYAGALYGVNPLGQPGVELGKRLTYGLMGRKGYERPEIPGVEIGNGDRAWRV